MGMEKYTDDRHMTNSVNGPTICKPLPRSKNRMLLVSQKSMPPLALT